MANNYGKTIKVATNFLPHLADKFNKRTVQYDKMLKQRVTSATRIVWATAHAKRPLITKTMMKEQGKSYRVSDPDATLGVPVKTGVLQGSITQKVMKTKTMVYQGEVATRGIPYAGRMEYGDGKVRARPFMRPAVNLNAEKVKSIFGVKVEDNL